ncbi:hypothetical protein HG547_04160 [Shewanella sp. DNRA4]|uniref:hypothetical protein n=1 Tax=Shewanella TaxID=22 RepID=UPI00112D101A|nr:MULTISPECIES: hypothetical protein [unclassified Shewanella]NMD50826.1 hypothetical protein [Shewanella sp. DNRA4]QQK58747.1 hypothetical protein FJD32_004000 [Shewanella sp. LC6]TPE55205.1 hypothetical protein FJD33_16950 [Shewanella sp. LC2]
MAPKGRVSTRFILRLRLSTEHHYAFKPSPCLKRVEFPLNEQIFNTIGISTRGSTPCNLEIATP